MKRGFTILELLVASLLLGMLVSVLTMLFNQSSISWRTGASTVAEMDDVRDNISEIRDEADNAYIWNGNVYKITGLWMNGRTLRSRAWNVGNEGGKNPVQITEADYVGGSVGVGSISSGKKMKTYTINVKSAGPDREFNTYDDIWSYPYEIN